MRTLAGFAAAAAMLTLSGAAHAQYPERPINVIIPFAAGGGADITARTLFPFVQKYMPEGTSFVPVNRAGGGGEVGFTEIALAEPDGYTIGAINTPSVVMKPHEHETRYTKDGFTYIANVAYDPSAIAVRADSPLQTIEQMIEQLKADPESLVAGTSGLGTEDHLLLARLGTMTGATVSIAPFKSSGEALLALKGGHVDLTVVNTTVSSTEIAEGTIRILALASDERWEHAPDAPTFQEMGIELISGSARGYGGPAGMPEEATAMLAEAIAKAVEDPEFIAAAEEQRLPLRYMASEEYAAFIDEQDAALAAQWAADPWIK